MCGALLQVHYSYKNVALYEESPSLGRKIFSWESTVPNWKLIGKHGQKIQKQKTLVDTSDASFFAPDIFICAFYLF